MQHRLALLLKACFFRFHVSEETYRHGNAATRPAYHTDINVQGAIPAGFGRGVCTSHASAYQLELNRFSPFKRLGPPARCHFDVLST